MDICVLSKDFGPESGGLGRHVRELAVRMVEDGHSVTVVTADDVSESVDGVDFVSVGSRDLGFDVFESYSSVWSIYRFLKHNQDDFDVIHAHSVYGLAPYFLDKFAGLDTDFVFTVHGIAYELISRDFLKPLAKVLHFPERVCVKNCDKVVAVSESAKKGVLEEYGVSGDRVKVIYNGVDTDRFRSVREFDNNLLYVGYFIERKGPDLVLDSFIDLKNNGFDDLELYLVGKGRMEDELREKVESVGLSDSVYFLSSVSDEKLVELYSNSIFVMPSKYEGQGIVYVEALSCGAPVIGCDNSAIPEMINDGENGFLVDRDKDAIGEAVEKLLNNRDLIKEFGSNARESALSFDWDLMAEKHLELYKDLLD